MGTGIFILPQSGRGHDADGRRTAGGNNPWSKNLSFRNVIHDASGCPRSNEKAIAVAKEAGALISFDPNIRKPLWDSMEDAREQVLYGLGQCDILKISDNEIQWLTGKEDYTDGVRWIRERYPVPLILVSMGKREAGRIIKTELWRQSRFFSQIRLRRPVREIRSVRVFCIMCWSMDWRGLKRKI